MLTLRFLLQSLRRLRWSHADLRRYQDQQVRRIVRYADKNVPFYRHLFTSHGLDPSDIRGVQDLHKIPVITKKIIRQYPVTDFISKDYDYRRLKALSTGGSTGEPFTIYIDDKEDAWRKAIYLRANISCGHRPRDRWVALIDSQYASGRSHLQQLLRLYIRNIVPVTTSRAHQYETTCRLRPTVLDGFPSSLRLLAIQHQRHSDPQIHPRIIFGSGELIDKPTIAVIEQTFNAPYFDQYGCTEIDRSAWQCINRQDYHLDCDSVITQFVDSAGQEVSSGEKGEIVYTSLFNYAYPLIRYNIEDVGIATDAACSCGLPLPLMKVVEGRSNAFLVFPDNTIVSPMRFIETLGAFRLQQAIDQYRVVQETPTHINVYIRKTRAEVDEAQITQLLKSNVQQGFSNHTSSVNQLQVEIAFVEEMPRTARGKLNVVTSRVNHSTFVNSKPGL
jgi:phenylacetate-CoA ligase